MPSGSSDPISILISRKYKSGHKNRIQSLARELSEIAGRHPGFISVKHVFNNHSGSENSMTLLKFDSCESLFRWQESVERERWLKKYEDYVEGQVERTTVTGLESFFEPSDQENSISQPARYKMVLVLTTVIFLLLITLKPVFELLLGSTPEIVRTFLLVAVQVVLMTYGVMPLVTRLLSSWLHGD